MEATQEAEQTSISQEHINKLLKSVKSNVDHLTVMSVEILAVSMDPNRHIAEPTKDPICAIFYALNMDVCNLNTLIIKGGFVLAKFKDSFRVYNNNILIIPTESELFYELSKIVQK